MSPLTIGGLASLTGLLPLLTVGMLAERNHRRAGAWWWMAVGFGVSFVADVVGRVISAPLASQVYPLIQSAIFLAVFLPVSRVDRLIPLLLLAAAISVSERHGEGLDILLRTVAWGSVAAVAWTHTQGALRGSLALAFGGGALAWLAYTVEPGWTTWGVFQGVRATATVWWCAVCYREARS